MFGAGKSQADVAKKLGVSRQSVSRWYQVWKKSGRQGLQGAGRAGRRPRLGKAEIKKIDAALREGPRAFGFSTEIWSLPRVAQVIEKATGVRYHPGHVWRILRHVLGWSLQRPAKRAKERNEERVRHWQRVVWPALKKKLGAVARGSSSRTKAESRSGPPSGERGHREDRHPS